MMQIRELTRIDRAVDIDAPPERVWRALTNAAELSAWFRVTIEGALEQGSEVWMTSTHAQYAGQRFRVQIVELTRPRRVVWKWDPGEIDANVDYASEPKTIVTFTLEPTAGGTRLTVSETGFDQLSLERRAKVYDSNAQGWAEVLVWLQTYVEANR